MDSYCLKIPLGILVAVIYKRKHEVFLGLYDFVFSMGMKAAGIRPGNSFKTTDCCALFPHSNFFYPFFLRYKLVMPCAFLTQFSVFTVDLILYVFM